MSVPELAIPAPAEWGPVERFEPGAVLLRQGHHVPTAMFIVSGVVKQTRLHTRGREALVNVLGEGWILGARPLTLDMVCLCSTVALTDCDVRPMPAASFVRVQATKAELNRYVLRMLARESRDHLIARAEFVVGGGRERVIWTLRRLIALFRPPVRDDGYVLELPLSQREVAQLDGMAEETLSRLLAELEAEGRLSRRKRTYILPVRHWGSGTTRARVDEYQVMS